MSDGDGAASLKLRSVNSMSEKVKGGSKERLGNCGSSGKRIERARKYVFSSFPIILSDGKILEIFLGIEETKNAV